MVSSLSCLSPSYFKLHVRWLPSLIPVTDWSLTLKYISSWGFARFAAFLQLELFRVCSVV
ncbi:hypothetical protein BFI45_04375 [Yersinia pestis subsp. microtus bv. Altaica]|nr:hypothetical protein CEQ20_22620 [Yersinia pseudotuberculosis]OSZ94103.1 hypothetical protein A7725_00425 [Yersinia pestis subsp. microtus bv. Caucasica]OUY16528.1 hypothetical protein BFI40_04790 [Yersinia pestis subsp. microtus bv. Altaica]OVY78817.1 hypothetical protein BFI50_01305 [Yersinia pestis subsp. microtus bv. Xilingolensis]OVY87254.1 hypothetical protein BFI52_02335 [Yersinia pestis subsp. microtus]PRH58870.1 hypothetical protein C6P85_00445 [Yersinia pestis]